MISSSLIKASFSIILFKASPFIQLIYGIHLPNLCLDHPIFFNVIKASPPTHPIVSL